MSFTKDQLAQLKELKAAGFSMDEIKELLADEATNDEATNDEATPKKGKKGKAAPSAFKGTTTFDDDEANVYVWHRTPKPRKDGKRIGYSAARLVIEYTDGNYRKTVTVALNVADAIRAIGDDDWQKISKNADALNKWVEANQRDGESMADTAARLDRD
jgi:DNA-binding transcriptional MerR regulator